MKTPEEVARQPFEAHPDLARWIAALASSRIEGMSLSGWGEFVSAVNAALAERDKRANALAIALRVLLLRHRDDRRQVSYRDARDAAIAALAAYDAEAK